jgi:hypothetical protein
MSFNPEWILNPLTTYAITGTGLIALLFLWVGAKVETSKCRHDIAAMKECTDTTLRELTLRVEEIVARPEPEAVQEYSVVANSLNLTRRTRALRMRRRGDAPHTIAAALNISRGEVDLMLKVDQMLQSPGD